ncbi:MAG: squalene--hopene cyclase [Candidatus Nitrosotenuis sp.]
MINSVSFEKVLEQGIIELYAHRHADNWEFPLEADTTITSEMILLNAYFSPGPFALNLDEETIIRFCNYLTNKQNTDGSWSLYDGGDGDVSVSVKAYYALKMAGVDEKKRFMRRACWWIRDNGGAEAANVFTHLMLAQFRQLSWEKVPCVPVDVVMNKRFLYRVSYWTRTVMVPLSIICSLRIEAANINSIGCEELFLNFKNPVIKRPAQSLIGKLAKATDRLLHWRAKWGKPKPWHINAAYEWITPRARGVDGLGAIFPAIVNSYIAFVHRAHTDLSESDRNYNYMVIKKALDALRYMIVADVEFYDSWVQPCVSPVWDTALAVAALQEAGEDVSTSIKWLKSKRIDLHYGDWAEKAKPYKPTGELIREWSCGWAFQRDNSYYPDVDDTAIVATIILNNIVEYEYSDKLYETAAWLVRMQSDSGGWGAFDRNNEHYWLNEIPFADHDAMIDPPTVDVTGRVVSFLAKLVDRFDSINAKEEIISAMTTGVRFIERNQEPNGGWWGRWGTNYLWGTWSAVKALTDAGLTLDYHPLTYAFNFLLDIQNKDGGWGESNRSYDNNKFTAANSNAFHTSLAVLTLCHLGKADAVECKRGIDWLKANFDARNGGWKNDGHNAPGFPRVFYLKYYGYAKYFPVWALAKYRNAISSTLK